MSKYRIVLINKVTDNESWDGEYYDSLEEAQESASILLSQAKVSNDVISFSDSSINGVFIENNVLECLIQEVDENQNVIKEEYII